MAQKHVIVIFCTLFLPDMFHDEMMVSRVWLIMKTRSETVIQKTITYRCTRFHSEHIVRNGHNPPGKHTIPV